MQIHSVAIPASFSAMTFGAVLQKQFLARRHCIGLAFVGIFPIARGLGSFCDGDEYAPIVR